MFRIKLFYNKTATKTETVDVLVQRVDKFMIDLEVVSVTPIEFDKTFCVLVVYKENSDSSK